MLLKQKTLLDNEKVRTVLTVYHTRSCSDLVLLFCPMSVPHCMKVQSLVSGEPAQGGMSSVP